MMELRASTISGKLPARAYVDAHVHIHRCFEIDRFLIAAAKNFHAQSSTCPEGMRPRYVLCLTESAGVDYFGQLSKDKNRTEPLVGRWSFQSSNSDVSLLASHPEFGLLELVAGRQIVTAERLEILALGTTRNWEDGQAIGDVVTAVAEANAIPVLPWGFGKWLGGRRRTVASVISRYSDGPLCLGDNSGRPTILPQPTEFDRASRLGMRILPGSDPLPFATECDRAGRFGFYLDNIEDLDAVWSAVQQQLRSGKANLHHYGRLESLTRFLRNQVAMQYVMRASKRRKAH